MRPPTAVPLLLALVLSSGCAATRRAPGTGEERPEVGYASYYAREFHGRATASGEPYDDRKLTAAHRALPFGTRVRVTNLSNGRSVVVRISDRGPGRRDRIIDLSERAARELGFLAAGVTRVRLDLVER
jgi:rare lipoprotein A